MVYWSEKNRNMETKRTKGNESVRHEWMMFSVFLGGGLQRGRSTDGRAIVELLLLHERQKEDGESTYPDNLWAGVVRRSVKEEQRNITHSQRKQPEATSRTEPNVLRTSPKTHGYQAFIVGWGFARSEVSEYYTT